MVRYFSPLLLLSLFLCPDAVFGQCNPVVGELYQNGVLKGSFQPIQGSTSLTNFYGWSTARPYFSTGRLAVAPFKSLLFVYRDSACRISVGAVHSAAGQGAGFATLQFTSSDFDVDIFASPTVKDDPEWFDIDEYVFDDVHRPATTIITWVWSAADADGMGVEFPATLSGCFTVTPVSWSGITTWRFVSGAGETPLTLSGPVEICINQLDRRNVDGDLDGVCNPGVISSLCVGLDLCPNTPPGEVVDISGCPATGAEPTIRPPIPPSPTPPAPTPPSGGCPKCPLSVFATLPAGCSSCVP